LFGGRRWTKPAERRRIDTENGTDKEEETILEQLLDNLNSRDKVLREDAERLLRALTPEELLQFSELEKAWFQKWSERAWAKVAVGVTLIAVIGAVMIGLLGRWTGFKHIGMGVVILYPIIILAVVFLV
jgi:hypothetical protein